MHGAAGDGAATYTMDFASDQIITRVAISSRENYTTRTGDTIRYYDASNSLLETQTIANGYYNNLKPADGYITGVRKIEVQENPAASDPLNFAEIEVFTAGLINVAPLGTASATSLHASFGADPARAIDESPNFASSGTVFHSGGLNDSWTVMLEKGYTLKLVEIQARTGFNNRIGNTLEFLDAAGDILFTEAITDSALFSLSGSWEEVYGVRITESGTSLNLAEVRLFADTSVAPLTAVPEPASLPLLLLGGLAMFLRHRR